MRMLLNLMMLKISPTSDIENTWATILYNFSMATMAGQILYNVHGQYFKKHI